jgi:hypothetical protein
MGTDETAELMTKEPKNMIYKTMIAIRESLLNLARSDDGEDGEDEDPAETEQGKLSEDDEHGWVIGKIAVRGSPQAAIMILV